MKNFWIGKDADLGKVTRPVEIALDGDLFLMAGPCVIESREICFKIAESLQEVCQSQGIGFIFKASFDKANRSSIESYRGPGIDEGLKILADIRNKYNVPVMTDIHESSQAEKVGKYVDCIQIPAFLCRQTDLLVESAKTGRALNIKKGQFLSPEEMTNVVNKVRSSGNDRIMLTERGTFFGYNKLVNDMTSIETMKKMDCPVIFDATHSTQQPGGLGNASAGRREMAPILARSAVAAGANGLFLEVHTNPPIAKSDAACIMPIEWVDKVVSVCKKISEAVKG